MWVCGCTCTCWHGCLHVFDAQLWHTEGSLLRVLLVCSACICSAGVHTTTCSACAASIRAALLQLSAAPLPSVEQVLHMHFVMIRACLMWWQLTLQVALAQEPRGIFQRSGCPASFDQPCSSDTLGDLLRSKLHESSLLRTPSPASPPGPCHLFAFNDAHLQGTPTPYVFWHVRARWRAVQVTHHVVCLARWMAADMYLREIDALRFELSMSSCSPEVGLERCIWPDSIARTVRGQVSIGAHVLWGKV